jgi:hypothetical protein
MNVEIGAEAPLFPEKEYISGIFVAVYPRIVKSMKRISNKTAVYETLWRALLT